MMQRGFDASSEQPAVYVTSGAADLLGDPEQLRATVVYAGALLGIPVELVVIDTLAANFGAGDENHASDMREALEKWQEHMDMLRASDGENVIATASMSANNRAGGEGHG
jgi:hypothetical protein